MDYLVDAAVFLLDNDGWGCSVTGVVGAHSCGVAVGIDEEVAKRGANGNSCDGR
jgi:hypothetical protein